MLFRSIVPMAPLQPEPGVDIRVAVERLVALRATARDERRFRDADAIREAIEALGVELVDAPTGARWSLRP